MAPISLEGPIPMLFCVSHTGVILVSTSSPVHTSCSAPFQHAALPLQRSSHSNRSTKAHPRVPGSLAPPWYLLVLCCDPSDLTHTPSSLIPSSVGDSKARRSSYLVFGRFAGIFTACFMSISISACLKTQHPPMPDLCAEGLLGFIHTLHSVILPHLTWSVVSIWYSISPIFRGTLSHPCLHLDILPPLKLPQTTQG